MLETLRELHRRYLAVDHPPTAEHDWRWRGERTLEDLDRSPKAWVVDQGERFPLPYVAGQYPDSMVQLTLVTSMRAYGRARGSPVPLAEEYRKGVDRFFDPTVGTLRRYLPSVPREKNYDAVDSWYLYHPMMNLARLAAGGDNAAGELLLRSVDYGIRAARHFDYAWPVFYDINDFTVITQQSDEDRPGETDSGGIYAYLMLQLHELTGDSRYLGEARAALEAADGHGLKLMYQVNLTALGAVACLRLWRVSGDEADLQRSYYWLANLLSGCQLVETDAGCARHHPTFMGLKCMYNSAYFAPLEDLDRFVALGEYLALGGEQIDEAAAELCRGFRRHAVHRGWYFYPDQLPAEIIAEKQESGHIDRTLSFPLEDLYPDGQRPGQIGQEIYGGGLAFAYAAATMGTGSEAVPLLPEQAAL